MNEREIAAALAEPFDPAEVKWKAQTVRDGRALAVAFVDARLVAERLDEVFGVGGWRDSYRDAAGGSVLCRLEVKVGGEWVWREDVGGESEQPDEGDRHKAAHSDALKRAAVKFGVARYLYRLGPQWVDYDAAKKRLAGTPRLPAWALPAPAKSPAAAAQADAPIGVAEASRLDELLIAASTAPLTVMKFYKVERLADLTRSQRDKVLERIGPKLPRKEGAA